MQRNASLSSSRSGRKAAEAGIHVVAVQVELVILANAAIHVPTIQKL